MRRPLFRTIVAACVAATLPGCNDSAAPRGPGAISVRATATVPEPFVFFQYGISIDKGTPRMANSSQDLVFLSAGHAHGKHAVELTGTPSHCTAGTHVRDVNLVGDDTASVVFDIVCARTTGDINVTVTTTGTDFDANGYRLAINGFGTIVLPVNGTSTFRYLTPATYTISLADVATNCTASAAQSVTITAGGVASVAFTVNCTPIAVVKFVATTTGTDADVDGYAYHAGSAVVRGPRTGTTYVRASAGTINYSVSDVQPNCTLSGASGSLTLASGDTATVTVTGSCTEIGFGTLGTSVADPAGDTLPNPSANPIAAHDMTNVSVRYAPGFAIIVLRFTKPVTYAQSGVASAVYGFVELDVDENTATGFQPATNDFGGNASMGVDVALTLFESDSVSTSIYLLSEQEFDSSRVPTKFQGDSVILQIPLNKLNDDGRFTFAQVVGTSGRPTDVAPNNGQVVARPAGAMVAGASETGARATAIRSTKPWKPGGWGARPKR